MFLIIEGVSARIHLQNVNLQMVTMLNLDEIDDLFQSKKSVKVSLGFENIFCFFVSS